MMRTLTFRYNHAGAPPMVSPDRVLAAAQRAAQIWSPCGVRIVLAGDTVARPGAYDGLDVIGWTHDKLAIEAGMTSDLAGATRRWTLRDKAVEVDIVLKRQTIRTAEEITVVLAHEFGHALGLEHSTDEGSLMRPNSAYAELDMHPSRADLAACRQLYPVHP